LVQGEEVAQARPIATANDFGRNVVAARPNPPSNTVHRKICRGQPEEENVNLVVGRPGWRSQGANDRLARVVSNAKLTR
jgi:hypothetical protein